MNVQDFQVIILAGGDGERLSPLCDAIPKPLLNVVNKPLISFPLDLAIAAGFTTILVVTIAKHKAPLEAFVLQYAELKQVTIQLFVVADDTDSADALRSVGQHVTKDFVLLSCDLVTSVDLSQVLNKHRSSNATCTMLLKHLVKKDAKDTSFKHEKQQTEYIGFNPADDRILFFSSSGEVEHNLKFKRGMLFSRPNMQLTTALLDCHLYIFSHWVIDFLSAKPQIQSIKHELVPLLVNQQLRKLHADGTWGHTGYRPPVLGSKLVDERNLPDQDPDILQTFQQDMRHLNITGCNSNDVIRCHAFLLPAETDKYCFRINYLSTYFDANKELMKRGLFRTPVPQLPPKVQVGEECIIAPSFASQEQVTIKASVIGANVVIGNRVRIVNSVVLDGTVVGSGTTVTNCLIASTLERPTKLGERCALKDCQTSAGVVLEDGTEATDEQFRQDEDWEEQEAQED